MGFSNAQFLIFWTKLIFLNQQIKLTYGNSNKSKANYGNLNPSHTTYRQLSKNKEQTENKNKRQKSLPKNRNKENTKQTNNVKERLVQKSSVEQTSYHPDLNSSSFQSRTLRSNFPSSPKLAGKLIRIHMRFCHLMSIYHQADKLLFLIVQIIHYVERVLRTDQEKQEEN